MFIIDLDFQLANDSDQSQAYDAVDNVLQAMRMNGQICSKEWGITLSGTSAYVRVLVPEAQALEQRYANQWVLNALNSPSISSMTINDVGADYIDDICDCSTTASYILYTYELLMSPALHCGACFRSIPLYRIPAFNNSEYFDILYWESTYQALDALDQAMGEQLNVSP